MFEFRIDWSLVLVKSNLTPIQWNENRTVEDYKKMNELSYLELFRDRLVFFIKELLAYRADKETSEFFIDILTENEAAVSKDVIIRSIVKVACFVSQYTVRFQETFRELLGQMNPVDQEILKKVQTIALELRENRRFDTSLFAHCRHSMFIDAWQESLYIHMTNKTDQGFVEETKEKCLGILQDWQLIYGHSLGTSGILQSFCTEFSQILVVAHELVSCPAEIKDKFELKVLHKIDYFSNHLFLTMNIIKGMTVPIESKVNGIDAKLRLLDELKRIRKDAPIGFQISRDDPFNLFKWKAQIVGLGGTIIEHSPFLLSLEFTNQYPQQPPVVSSPICHPNFDGTGNLSQDWLKSIWKPDLSILDLLKDIQTLLNEPNLNFMVNNKAADLYLDDKDEFYANLMQIGE